MSLVVTYICIVTDRVVEKMLLLPSSDKIYTYTVLHEHTCALYMGIYKNMLSKCFQIAFPLQGWSGPLLPQRENQPWPQERSCHTAYSMLEPDSDPEHPCLVIVGGLSQSGEPLGDVWLFYIKTSQWEEVSELRLHEAVNMLMSP